MPATSEPSQPYETVQFDRTFVADVTMSRSRLCSSIARLFQYFEYVGHVGPKYPRSESHIYTGRFAWLYTLVVHAVHAKLRQFQMVGSAHLPRRWLTTWRVPLDPPPGRSFSVCVRWCRRREIAPHSAPNTQTLLKASSRPRCTAMWRKVCPRVSSCQPWRCNWSNQIRSQWHSHVLISPCLRTVCSPDTGVNYSFHLRIICSHYSLHPCFKVSKRQGEKLG